MIQVPQGATREVVLKLFNAGTTTEATGKTVAVTIRKAGGSYANPSAGATNATEVAHGTYYVSLSTTDTNTLGDLIVRGTASGCDASERIFAVVPAANGGLTNLDAAVSTRSTYAGGDTAGTTTLLSRVTGAVLLASGYTAPLDAAGTRTAVGLAAANLDTQLGDLPTAAETAAATLATGDADGYTLEQATKLILAAVTGKLSGAATTTVTIRAADDSKVRITATVDEDGNRTAVTLDATG